MGKGRPVFMLHGWGGDITSWTALVEHLDLKSNHVFCLDMPGFGKSDDPGKPWKVEDYKSFFEAFVQKMYTQFKLKGSYNIISHSFGGRVTIKLASEKGNKLNKIILIAAAGIRHPLSLKKRLFQKVAKCGTIICSMPILRIFKNSIRKIMYKLLRVHDYERTSGVMKKTFVNVINEDLTRLLEHIKCSALIVWGKNDTYVPVSDAHLMNKKIKNSKLKIIEAGRHGIHRTHAKTLGTWINKFLKD